MAVNDDLFDDAVMRSLRAMRAGNGIWRSIRKDLIKLERELVEKLNGQTPRTLAAQRSQKLLREIRQIIDGGAQAMRERLEARGVELADIEERAAYASLSARVPIASTEWVRPSQSLITAVATARPFEGAILKDHIAKWSTDTVFRMQAELRTAILAGEGVDPMQRRLRRVAEISRQHARSISRTYAMHVTNQARATLYEQNKDIIAAEVWAATLDTRTCLRCAPLDNKRFPVGKGPQAPIHMNCRCVRVPLTRSAEALERRGIKTTRSAADELNGNAPSDLSYEAWLRRRTDAEQIEVLGPARFEIWQKGGKLDRFVNDENDILTLDELRDA
ncbi:MAG: phage minor head protein [Pseudomonadota bacterium]